MHPSPNNLRELVQDMGIPLSSEEISSFGELHSSRRTLQSGSPRADIFNGELSFLLWATTPAELTLGRFIAAEGKLQSRRSRKYCETYGIESLTE